MARIRIRRNCVGQYLLYGVPRVALPAILAPAPDMRTGWVWARDIAGPGGHYATERRDAAESLACRLGVEIED